MATIKKPSGFVPGSLSRHIHAWRELGTVPPAVLDWIQFGFPLHLHRLPKRVRIPNYVKSEDQAFVTQELQRLVDQGALTEVQARPYLVLPIGVVPKKGGKRRLIHNLRYLNKFLAARKFKYEDISTIAEIVQEGDWMTVLDVQDGFYHISIHPASRWLLGLEWQGRYFVWNVLPMGLSLSPWVFTKITRPILQYLRQIGHKATAYMDDFSLINHSRPGCLALTQLFCDLMCRLGWFLSESKSRTTPSQRQEVLGFQIDTTGEPTLRVPAAKIRQASHQISRLLRKAEEGPVPVRHIAQLAGQLVSMTRAIVRGKLLLRSFYRCIAKRRSWKDLVARAIHNICAIHQIQIRAVHLPGTSNDIADRESRRKDRYNWRISSCTWTHLQHHFGPHTIDRFAAFDNALLPRYNARFRDPTAAAVDALEQNWRGENNFAAPPFRLLPRILTLIQTQKVEEVTLIAPYWPAQPWTDDLLRLSVARPILLSGPRIPASHPLRSMISHRLYSSARDPVYLAGQSGIIEPLKNDRWFVLAWRLSGSKERQVGLKLQEI
eukprot:TRINITY_DN213_c0_g1_i6.p2 TRINITY_DN213_c0_g1~~TRINITY_DN213_c0_g1_i6.p2  ORF type:complete len:549 (+),score=20.96 TRINITY_DN213_c0_g1_i6:1731-3377(+)